eukprot:gene7407-7616_t
MLPRKPTRIELKPEDKEEYEELKKQLQLSQQQGTSGLLQVEVKLRLSGREAYARLEEVLRPGKLTTHQQENYFFDGPNRELNSQMVVLRLRFYNDDKKAVITLKGKQVLAAGIGRASEVEEEVDPIQARKYLQEPSSMLLLPSTLIQDMTRHFALNALMCLGGFNNSRQEIAWQGFTLELDETMYPWGTLYELEAETDKPEELRDQLEKMLQKESITYSYSTTSKFANFINTTLL